MTDLKQRCREYYTRNFPGYDAVDGLPGLEAFALAVRKEALEECYARAKQYRSEYGALGLDYSHFMDWLQAQLDQAHPDNCQICKGSKGGVSGNENIVNGVVMCDYCHAAQAQS